MWWEVTNRNILLYLLFPFLLSLNSGSLLEQFHAGCSKGDGFFSCLTVYRVGQVSFSSLLAVSGHSFRKFPALKVKSSACSPLLGTVSPKPQIPSLHFTCGS